MEALQIITPAIIGLLGVGIGGYVTYKIERSRQHFTQKQEEEREMAAARGAARVLLENLNRRRVMLDACIQTKRWHPPSDPMSIELPYEDWRLIASSPTINFETIVKVNEQLWVCDRIANQLEHLGDRSFGEDDLETTKNAAEVLGLAMKSLEEMAQITVEIRPMIHERKVACPD